MKHWDKSLVEALIPLYYRYPVLYAFDMDGYLKRSNAKKRKEALERITEELCKIQHVTLHDVKLKLKNLRGHYIGEKLKSLKTGREPTLWYYKQLSFLDKHVQNSITILKAQHINESDLNESSNIIFKIAKSVGVPTECESDFSEIIEEPVFDFTSDSEESSLQRNKHSEPDSVIKVPVFENPHTDGPSSFIDVPVFGMGKITEESSPEKEDSKRRPPFAKRSANKKQLVPKANDPVVVTSSCLNNYYYDNQQNSKVLKSPKDKNNARATNEEPPPDGLDCFGKYLVSELRTIHSKTLLHDTKMAILGIVNDAVQKQFYTTDKKEEC